MSEQAKVQAVCECGHAANEHGLFGCAHVENQVMCACGVSVEFIAFLAENKVSALRQQLAEAQVEKVQAERDAFVDGANWANAEGYFSDLAGMFKQDRNEQAATRYPDAAQGQAVGEVKRPMPTRDDVVSAIIQNAHISNYGCDQVANAIMALFTDSAGGGQ